MSFSIVIVFDVICFSFELFKRTSCRKDEGMRGLLKKQNNNKTSFLVKLWPVAVCFSLIYGSLKKIV